MCALYARVSVTAASAETGRESAARCACGVRDCACVCACACVGETERDREGGEAGKCRGETATG